METIWGTLKTLHMFKKKKASVYSIKIMNKYKILQDFNQIILLSYITH